MKTVLKYIFVILTLSLCHIAFGQNKGNVFGNAIEFDKVIYDFGDVIVDSGPLKATYTLKNIGSAPLVIYQVVSSCGCTEAKWTKEPIQPGKTGTVTGVYSNDEGPYPFDKTLTVYTSSYKKPIILRIRGVARKKALPLSQAYPEHFGPLGFRETTIKGGNLSQDEQKSGSFLVANVSDKPAKISFEKVSPGLQISLSKTTIPARSTATLNYTITASRERWGKNWYSFTPVVNGMRFNGKKVSIYAYTKENFGSWDETKRKNGSFPMFDDGATFEFGQKKAGSKFEATFSFTNKGKSDFKIYKIDSDSRSAKLGHVSVPATKPGAKGSFRISVDTAGMPKGETCIIIMLTTNSPSRPIINLFITGYII
ncbi:MAG: DUF1573 domain-containing protein [Bacteroidales bacterium]|nr:DUF1573 domain-containing protein [Bacteroidales bacterium]